jgi:hypothetical protein
MQSVERISTEQWREAMAHLRDIKQCQVPLQLPVRDNAGSVVGQLEPITARHLEDSQLIATFVRWRNVNRSGYLDQRPVDDQSTAKWLADVVANERRISLLIYFGEKLIGRCGAVNLSPEGHEADSLVRGERGGGFGFLLAAQRTGLAWLFASGIGGSSVSARVLDSNDLALHNCRELGYEMTPVKVERSSIQNYSSSGLSSREEGPELWTLKMSREQFQRQFPTAAPNH